MEGPPPPQSPQPPKACAEKWRLDVAVAVSLLTVAGAVILLLLYRLLQLRHRLRLARAGHALEYFSFFHTATYTLRHPAPCQDPPAKNGSVPEGLTAPPQPPSLAPPPQPLPPPPVLPPPPPVHPLPLPVIHTTPPSPHLSWGACSDADVYSRIGAFRPSRLSSLSSHSKVILFEHSSL